LVLIVFGTAAYDEILVFAPACHFKEGVIEAKLKLFLSFSSAFVKALGEDFHAGGREEDIHKRACDSGIAAVPNGARALNVDIHKDVRARGEVFLDGILSGAVEIAVNLCVFEKVCISNFRFELRTGEEVIIFSVFFPRTRISRGAGYGINEVTKMADAMEERAFTSTRRS
jgi:hypothetical protein